MIEFILNNKRILTDKNPGMTLLDFVRYEQRLTGTKIGCREGDCGACTVLIGELDEIENLRYLSITSCISPLGNAHGKHVVSIEGTNLIHKLTRAQQAMKNNFATQCGFCTPGFVVSLTGFVLSNQEKSFSNACDAIGGNICRCTGYKSIERAAEELSDSIDFIDGTRSIDWLIANDFIPEYFNTIVDRLKQIDVQPLKSDGLNFVSGGTDLYVQRADDLIASQVNLIHNDPKLNGIKISEGRCYIGSGATVSDMWYHKTLKSYFPNLLKHLKLVSSEPIRNMASLGGNLVNASPIGDMTIFFLALNSELTIINSNGKIRRQPLSSFYKSYKTFDLAEDELIKSVSFDLPLKNSKFNFEKVCKRTHLDIASVNSASLFEIENDIIKNAHISIGGVAAIPKYLHETSAFLKGKKLSVHNILDAETILQNEISPISDVRGSAEYKRLLARQLFFAHFIELFQDQIQLKELIRNE
ncbi:MAG: 2Fe-2S iron-sulfur cluster binding domain-containing protein [Flavobacteriaceae bacterium]|nr:2Fe-2S iron-sulfur cluster binding domain-containing protein [Flavobacteriaceae bacterium]NNK60268.1 2Fe-2S iron-sulfur cluster binding domain-containing protein [Flavobacteriaceae bacterium]